MRFFLLVYQYCPHEVAELTDTFLAKDGIGFAAELGEPLPQLCPFAIFQQIHYFHLIVGKGL